MPSHAPGTALIGDQAMVALRKAATLAHVVPTVQLRVRRESDVRFHVARAACPHHGTGDQPDGTVLTPCAFRAAVVRAHLLRRQGVRLSFLDLGAEETPSVDVVLAPGDHASPDGLYQLRDNHQWRFMFATTLDMARCREAALREAIAPWAKPVKVAFHVDEDTGVTLVHATAEAEEATLLRHRVVLSELFVRFGAEELADALAPA